MDSQSALPDFFENFKEIVFEADTIISLEKRKEYLYENKEYFSKGLGALKASKDYVALGVMLKLIKSFDLESNFSFFNYLPSKELCHNLEQYEKEILQALASITFKRVENLFDKASGKKVETYLDRHRFLEFAIRLVWEILPGENDEWFYLAFTREDACLFIAKCYLLRSKIALPKGSDIPEKKLEAINKAWEWSNKAVTEINDLKLEIALEKERWDKNLPEDFMTKILDEFWHSCEFDPANSIHRSIYDKSFHLIILEKNYDDEILNITHDKKDPYFYLHQAKAAFRKKENFTKKLNKSIDSLRGVPLSFPLWSDTVDFIKKMKAEKKEYWQDAAIKAWEICQEEEKRLKLGIQIRWYWSRQAELYDIAFIAAIEKKDPLLAAEIADSLKSRPAVKLLQAEKSLDKEDLETLYSVETNFAASSYNSEYDNAKEVKTSFVTNKRSFNDVPAQWVAVHFYISLDRIAYAIKINSDGNNEIIKIDVEHTWNAYKDWKFELQEAEDNPDETEASLQKLCDTCGKMLEPVIKKIGADNILFIPHGFLHLIPIHCAFIENTPLFKTKICLFLPAWPLAEADDKTIENQEGALFTNWSSETDLEKFIDNEIWSNKNKKGSTPEDYCSYIKSFPQKSSPALLAFYCHGEGDFLNPYRSSLKLNGDLTHQAIVNKTSKNALFGTKVILTACESDLVSGGSDIVDEHLSIAAAFINKGASEVCGTLFKCMSDIASEIIESSINNLNKTLCEDFHGVLREWFDKGHGKQLYKVAAFRVMGMPEYERKKL